MDARGRRKWERGLYHIAPRSPWPLATYGSRNAHKVASSFVRALCIEVLGEPPHWSWHPASHHDFYQWSLRYHQARMNYNIEDFPINP
jgi:hypothetical protein